MKVFEFAFFLFALLLLTLSDLAADRRTRRSLASFAAGDSAGSGASPAAGFLFDAADGFGAPGIAPPDPFELVPGGWPEPAEDDETAEPEESGADGARETPADGVWRVDSAATGAAGAYADVSGVIAEDRAIAEFPAADPAVEDASAEGAVPEGGEADVYDGTAPVAAQAEPPQSCEVIFEDTITRDVRACPLCGCENDPFAACCEVCGGRF